MAYILQNESSRSKSKLHLERRFVFDRQPQPSSVTWEESGSQAAWVTTRRNDDRRVLLANLQRATGKQHDVKSAQLVLRRYLALDFCKRNILRLGRGKTTKQVRTLAPINARWSKLRQQIRRVLADCWLVHLAEHDGSATVLGLIK